MPDNEETDGIFIADLFVFLFADRAAALLCGTATVAEFCFAFRQLAVLRLGRARYRFFDAVFDFVGVCVRLFDRKKQSELSKTGTIFHCIVGFGQSFSVVVF